MSWQAWMLVVYLVIGVPLVAGCVLACVSGDERLFLGLLAWVHGWLAATIMMAVLVVFS